MLKYIKIFIFSLDFLWLSIKYIRSPIKFLFNYALWKFKLKDLYTVRLKSGDEIQNLIYVDLVTYHFTATQSISGCNKKRYKFLRDIISIRDYEQIDFSGKVVLDIGGFIGDSASYFLEKNAKKVIIFEPIKEKINLIKALLNKEIRYDIVELYNLAVCDKTGHIEIKSSFYPLSVCFGEYKDNSPFIYKVKVDCISWKDLIELVKKFGVDIIKVDCEGYERYIANLDCDLIRNIKEWLLEFHDKTIEHNIVKKFYSCGFNAQYIRDSNNSIVYFYRC